MDHLKLVLKLLRKGEVTEMLGYSGRTIDSWSQRHEARSQMEQDPHLPSSPANGLYSMQLGVTPQAMKNGGDCGNAGAARRGKCRERRWDPRDIREFLENGRREPLGLPLDNWRRPPVRQVAARRTGK